MSYFDFYDIEESFFINEKSLKKIFLEKSQEYHPDFHSMENEEAKEKSLELSALNNQAYETLKSFDKRVQYILEINHILNEEGENKVPNEFLMEVMDLNETLMELKFKPDEEKIAAFKNQVKLYKEKIYNEVEQDMMQYVKDSDQAENVLQNVKEYFLKNKYLKRLEENLEE